MMNVIQQVAERAHKPNELPRCLQRNRFLVRLSRLQNFVDSWVAAIGIGQVPKRNLCNFATAASRDDDWMQSLNKRKKHTQKISP